MNEADAQEAAGGFDAEALGQIQRVVVAVPGEDAAFAEERGDFRGRVIGEADGDCRAALVKSLRIGDAEKLQAGNCQQARRLSLREQLHFMLARGAVGGEQGAAAIFGRWIAAATELGEVINGGADSSD